jgi:UDP-N-acetylmuramate dehydrogenase
MPKADPLNPELLGALVAVVGAERVRLSAPLAPCTTFHVGGPADCLVETHDSVELGQVVDACRRAGVPCTMLGGGSNTLIADEGIRGVVVRAHGGRIAASDNGVSADAGVTMNAVVRWTIGRGYAGLEAWAGTPGTVGGAIYGNAHYGGQSIGELVAGVSLLCPDGSRLDVPRRDMDFAYDRSRLQRSGEVLLSARFGLQPGADPAELREVARASLAHRKRTQPLHLPSAGCIFQNPGSVSLPDGVPPSAGALIDRAGLKGRSIGGARVSTVHANFIVNEGDATAAQIHELVLLCRDEVRRAFGVELELEIRVLGF